MGKGEETIQGEDDGMSITGDQMRERRSHDSLDLAKIFQKTVVSLMRSGGPDDGGERKSAYHWAAFTFQGWWSDLPKICLPSSRAKA